MRTPARAEGQRTVRYDHLTPQAHLRFQSTTVPPMGDVPRLRPGRVAFPSPIGAELKSPVREAALAIPFTPHPGTAGKPRTPLMIPDEKAVKANGGEFADPRRLP